LSLEYATVLISVVLVTTTPLWSAMLEALFLRARLSQLTVIGLAIAIVGGVLISLPGENAALDVGENPLLGGLLALAGAVAVAVYLVIGRSVRARLPLIRYIWPVYTMAALFALVVVALTRTPITGDS